MSAVVAAFTFVDFGPSPWYRSAVFKREQNNDMAEQTGKQPDKRERDKKTIGGRSKGLYIGSVIILVLVVVTFVGAPVVGGMGGSGNLVFGRYAGEDIAYAPGNFFARQYEGVAQQLRDSGNEMDIEWQLRLAWRQAFNSTVLRTAILHTARQSGARVSEERIDERIARDPRFNQNGRFDVAAYRATGNQERFQLRNFHRENTLFERVVEDILGGAPISPREVEFVANMSGPERSFDVVRFPFSRFPESQVVLYAQDEAELFAELNLSVITVATEEEAQRVRQQATEPGNPFGELARTFSRDAFADQNGEIGSVWGYELQQELLSPESLTALINLSPGDISTPVETTSGWAIYRAEEGVVPFSADRPEAVATARSFMQTFEQGRIQDFVRDEATQFVASFDPATESLNARAGEIGLSVASTNFFPINFGNQQIFNTPRATDIPDLTEAANRERFFEIAFALEEDQLSEPVLLRQAVIVLRLREERDLGEDGGFIVREFYDSLHQQFLSEEVEDAYVQRDLLQDNFNQAFNRFILGVN